MADTSAGDEQIVVKFGAVCSWLSSTTYFCSKGPSGGKKSGLLSLKICNQVTSEIEFCFDEILWF